MVVFDEKGKFVRCWGKEFRGGAHGLHLEKEGTEEFLYLCDTRRGVVVKASLKGEEVLTWVIQTILTSISWMPRAGRLPSTALQTLRWLPTVISMSGMVTV